MKNQIRFYWQLPIVLLLMFIFVMVSTAYGQADEPASGTLRNPLNLYGGADPWLTYYEGNYYLTSTTWASEWFMRKSPTLAGLKTAEPVRIYFETDPTRCCNFWAPEFYLLDGPNGLRWYFYYTAGTADTNDNQHTHVLESEGMDPLGPYTYKARLYDPQHDTWAIDGSVMQLNGEMYFLFSAFEDGLQSLFIAPMSNPWTLSGERSLISQPEFPWETSGGVVNEAPVALHHEDQTFIVYSASGCWTPDYKLGMLIYNGSDPLSITSWVKHPEPIFQRSDENGVFAPGHNGFFKSPDGTEDWIVYHANDSVNGGCDGRRSTRVQRISWNEDGLPNLGIPVSTEEVIAAPSGDTGVDSLPELPAVPITRFQSYGLEGAYLNHVNFYMRLDYGNMNITDSMFRIVPGLADAEAVSIESVNFPGFFLAHERNTLVLRAYNGMEDYAARVTWWLRPGLANADAISFEAYSQPGNYIGRRFSVVALIELSDTTPDTEREDATFILEQ